MGVRKRIDMRLPDNLLTAIDKFCADEGLTRTAYFEMLARVHLRKRNRVKIRTETVRNWDNIEDMPAVPNMRRVEVYQ